MKVHFNISGKSRGSREVIGDLVRTLHDTGADSVLLVALLEEYGVYSAQGYLIGQPAPVDTMIKQGSGIR